MKNATTVPDFLCLIPVFNDWDSIHHLASQLDEAARKYHVTIELVIVNDGSTEEAKEFPRHKVSPEFLRIRQLNLLCNLGHQRAIAVGLAHLALENVSVPVVVMDGDGEDQPIHAPELVRTLRAHPEWKVVFAARTRRFESWRFKTMYHSFRFLHWLLTGIAIRFGNFSALSPAALQSLSVSQDLWNHYAAAVVASKLKYGTMPLPRGKRVHGNSKMNFPSLIAHGLSGISVFNETMTARLLFLSLVAVIAIVATLIILATLRIFTDFAPQGWTTIIVGILLTLLTQTILSILVLTFGVLGNRSTRRVIPRLEAHMFIRSVEWMTETPGRSKNTLDGRS